MRQGDRTGMGWELLCGQEGPLEAVTVRRDPNEQKQQPRRHLGRAPFGQRAEQEERPKQES